MHTIPKQSFADIAVALRLELRHDVSTFTDAAALAIRIGLEPGTCARLSSEAQHQADMIAAAWQFFRVACEREEQIRALFAKPHEASNDNLSIWGRAVDRVRKIIWGRHVG